jgi:hypothetical protein
VFPGTARNLQFGAADICNLGGDARWGHCVRRTTHPSIVEAIDSICSLDLQYFGSDLQRVRAQTLVRIILACEEVCYGSGGKLRWRAIWLRRIALVAA